MYRAAGHGGRSKANPSTQCQKCLKRDIYECTVTAQERPYKPRPSRTQQLLNPQLKPKLTTEVPNDLLRKKGVADEILAKKEEERGQKGGKDNKRRSRSVSTYSSDSVSTISTNRSPSRSQSARCSEQKEKHPLRGGDERKRRRRSVSSGAYHSDNSHNRSRSRERNTRRRLSSFSPVERGRRRSRSSPMDLSHDARSRPAESERRLSRRRRHSRGRRGAGSRSKSKDSYRQRPVLRPSTSRSPSWSSNRMDTSDDRHPPPRSGITEPAKNRWGKSSPTRQHSASRSRSRSPGREHRKAVSSHHRRRSPSPYSRRLARRSSSPFRASKGHPHDDGLHGDKGRHEVRHPGPDARQAPPAPLPQRERSLSPYSKRVALTRQMQVGR